MVVPLNGMENVREGVGLGTGKRMTSLVPNNNDILKLCALSMRCLHFELLQDFDGVTPR